MSKRKSPPVAAPVEEGDPFAPRRNPHLVGQTAAEETLLAAWNGGRMHHAWLIGGPPGIGKATLAFRFARFVLSRSAEPDDGPGLFGDAAASPDSLAVGPESPIFHRIAAGGHADLLTVERARDAKRDRLRRDIAVDDVRRIAPFLHMTSGEGGWRVAIIDGADRMNISGMNAILKILEEPPARALLLLVSDNPGGMLPTIRSRTRKLSLEPLGDAAVVALLARYRPELDGDDAATVARLSEGSVGRAVALADAGGLALYREMLGLLAELPTLDVPTVHAFAERVGRAGADELYETTCELLVWWLARLVRFIATGVAPAETVPGEAGLMSRLAGVSGLDRWMMVWEKTAREFSRAEAANLDRVQVMINVLLGLESSAG